MTELVNQYGTGMVKTAGLFLPGKLGYATSGLTYALDQAKPSDSVSDQLIDGGLGLAKGLGTRATFQIVGSKELGIASKAVSLGISTRVIDSALTRQTYAEGNSYSALAGLSRTFDQSFNRSALAADVITFGLAHGAASGLNGITGGALKNSPFLSNVTTGGFFGVSAGGVSEINRQRQAGEQFDISKVLTTAALTGVTDMVASVPGAHLTAKRAARVTELAENTSDMPTGRGSDSSKIAPLVQRNFNGSTAREFQLVNASESVLNRVRGSNTTPVVTAVQEVMRGGELGPVKNMLIQHLEPGKSGTSTVESNKGIYGFADLIATCNPSALPEALRRNHVIPQAESIYLTESNTGRLRFTDALPAQLKAGESQPVKLGGQTVSEVLLGPQTPKYLEDTHNKEAMARAMRGFKTPVRYFNGGADSIAFELPDRNILKITDHGWDPSWGSREIWTPGGARRIDAPIVRPPQTIELQDAAITFFVQKRMLSPVTERDLRQFNNQIEHDGKYKFWDNDFKEHGQKQLGFDPDTHELLVIDYDSVRVPKLVPKQQVEGDSWIGNRYLHRYRNRLDED